MVYTSTSTLVVCVLHDCTQNNMDHKEKGIFIVSENMVKCVTVTTNHILWCFILQLLSKIAELMLDVICIYI